MNSVFVLLKGFSQVMLQENIILGFLMMVGLYVASPTVLSLTIIGNITGSFLGYFIDFPKESFQAGLYGYNGVLVGVAVSALAKQFPLAVLLTIVGSALSVLIVYLFFKNNAPAYTAPFVLASWALILLIKLFH